MTTQTIRKIKENEKFLHYMLNTQCEYLQVYIDQESFPFVKIKALIDTINMVLLTKPIEAWKDTELHKAIAELSYELKDVDPEITMGELA